MKTTIEIADALLDAARKRAARRGVTLRTLVEEGLRRVLHEPAPAGFKLQRRTFGGSGRADDGSWEGTRDLIYPGRGA